MIMSDDLTMEKISKIENLLPAAHLIHIMLLLSQILFK